MTLQDIQTQVRQLPDADKWQLVMILLNELQQPSKAASEAHNLAPSPEVAETFSPWIKQLIGIAPLEPTEDPKELYIDYLEEKYRLKKNPLR
ncbi:MAG: hypothetical protein HC795_10985 [Coleofasciculaceae cyanobacterium RL_1_1]|nr:hypothetical protein [Coleofasciculaceae cyanobacterium RL_1_1]